MVTINDLNAKCTGYVETLIGGKLHRVPTNYSEYRKYKIKLIKKNFKKSVKRIAEPFHKLFLPLIDYVKFIFSPAPEPKRPAWLKNHIDKDGSFKYKIAEPFHKLFLPLIDYVKFIFSPAPEPKRPAWLKNHIDKDGSFKYNINVPKRPWVQSDEHYPYILTPDQHVVTEKGFTKDGLEELLSKLKDVEIPDDEEIVKNCMDIISKMEKNSDVHVIGAIKKAEAELEAAKLKHRKKVSVEERKKSDKALKDIAERNLLKKKDSNK